MSVRVVSRQHRFRNLAAFALLAFIGLYLLINFSAAWMYVSFLSHPACYNPDPPAGGSYSPQVIHLSTLDGLSVPAWYYPPRNGGVILAIDGPGGALWGMPPVDFLLDAGYGVVKIGSRVCADPPSAVTIGAKEIMEAQAAVAFLQAQPEVRHIGAFGFSMGGVTVIRAAARQPAIEAVIAEGGYYNMGRDFVEADHPLPWWQRSFLYTVAGVFWLKNGVNPFEISPVDDIARISPRPVLLIYGSKEIDDGRGKQQYESARPPKTLWVVPGGTHGGNYAIAQQEYRQRVKEFFDQYLLTATSRHLPE